VVALLDRTSGAVLATLSIPESWGFVPPTSLADSMQLDLTAVLPEAVQQDIVHVWGEEGLSNGSSGISSFLGAGGFVDNTVGIAPNGDIYVVGGGPHEKSGALVQVRVVGTAEAPTLSPGWHAVLDGHSATTPSISADGRWVVIGDGSVAAALIGNASGSVKAYDTRVCAGVVGAPCDPAWQESLQRWPLPGAPAIAPDGTVIFYEMALGQPGGPHDRDLVAVGPTGVQWESTLPDGLDWTSVVTVSDNHIIGTASRIVPSTEQLLSVGFPSTVDDYLVVLDRRSGALRWKAGIPDDSAATVTIGPDGALYVGMLGLLSVMSLDEHPTLGLMKFSPTAGPDEGHAVPPRPTPADPGSPTPDAGGPDDPTPDVPIAPRDAEPGTSNADPACFAIDIEAQPTCCADGPAHCVPDTSIPASFHDRLARCDEGGLCVPDSILASEHRIAPPPCESIGGAEGACVSVCVPAVGEMAALLPKEGCGSDEVCVPCISPLDNQPTGVCGVIECGGDNPTGGDSPEDPEGADEEPPHEGGDGGGADSPNDGETDPADPSEPGDEPRPEGAISCCGGAGTCLLADIVPEGQQGSVDHCGQEGHRDLLCVPNEFLDPTWTPQACHGTSLMQNEYDGVCLPDCLRLPLEFALDRRPCQDGFACTPCLNPLTGQPSGAPGCDAPP
jgi:outer membrane protein assembly factor BamB